MAKKIRKFLDVDKDLDFKIKSAANNLSILKGKTVTEKELLLKWISEGVKKTLKELNSKM